MIYNGLRQWFRLLSAWVYCTGTFPKLGSVFVFSWKGVGGGILIRWARWKGLLSAYAHTHTHTRVPACCTDQPVTVDVIFMSRDSFRMQSVLQSSDAVVRVCVFWADLIPLVRLQPGLLRKCGHTVLRQHNFAVPRLRLPSHRPGDSYQQLEGGADGSKVYGELVRFPGQ